MDLTTTKENIFKNCWKSKQTSSDFSAKIFFFFCPNVVSFHLDPEISHDFLAHRLRSTQQPTFEGQIKKILNEDKFTASHYCANTVNHRGAGCIYNGLQVIFEDKGWEKGKV